MRCNWQLSVTSLVKQNRSIQGKSLSANTFKISPKAVDSLNDKSFPHRSGLFSVLKPVHHWHLFKKYSILSPSLCTAVLVLYFFRLRLQACLALRYWWRLWLACSGVFDWSKTLQETGPWWPWLQWFKLCF